METCSTLIISFCISATPKVKPLLKSLDSNLQGATLIWIFFKKFDYFLGSAKIETKMKFFWRHATPFFQNVPRFCFLRLMYMNLKKKQNFMYPAQWYMRVRKVKLKVFNKLLFIAFSTSFGSF